VNGSYGASQLAELDEPQLTRQIVLGAVLISTLGRFSRRVAGPATTFGPLLKTTHVLKQIIFRASKVSIGQVLTRL